MSDPDDGGPAFPHSSNPMRGDLTEWGMTLRDWFAGQALPACISAPCPPAWTNDSAEHRKQSAAAAYLIADEMISFRNTLP